MKKIKKELQEIIGSVKAYMQAERLAGIEEFYLEPGLLCKDSVSAVPGREPLDKLRQEVTKCRRCPLYKTRTNPVFGQGNLRARLIFVGEAPGREEDLQGLAFIGRAGELLTKIIQAMGFARSDVYICNVLKCRPPENRNPLPTEVDICRDYLRRQLEIINPRVICCLGKFACQSLFNQELPISKIRGSFKDFNGIKVMPTFHPAYLLRNPSAKRLVWEDMRKVMAELKKERG